MLILVVFFSSFDRENGDGCRGHTEHASSFGAKVRTLVNVQSEGT